MKVSARYLTMCIREERIRDYASATRKLCNKIGHADIIGHCASRALHFRQLLESAEHVEEVWQKEHVRHSSLI